MLDNTAFLLDGDGRLVVDTDAYGNQSFATVSGVASMVQSVRLRLTTPKGSLPMHPNLGFPINQALGVLNAPFVEAEAKRSILLDPDVGEVPHAEAVVNPGDGRIRVGSVSIDLLSVDGAHVPLEVSL